jgi:hypothetical protein
VARHVTDRAGDRGWRTSGDVLRADGAPIEGVIGTSDALAAVEAAAAARGPLRGERFTAFSESIGSILAWLSAPSIGDDRRVGNVDILCEDRDIYVRATVPVPVERPTPRVPQHALAVPDGASVDVVADRGQLICVLQVPVPGTSETA